MLIKLDENSPNCLKVALWKTALTTIRTRTHVYNCMHGNYTYTLQNTCTPNVRPGYHCDLCTDDRGSTRRHSAQTSSGAHAPSCLVGTVALLSKGESFKYGDV